MSSVCVLLPYRNAQSTIVEALESSLAQRDVRVHVIAVDDGSTDNSSSLVHALAARHSGIECVASGGVGIVGALQRGSSFLRSEWVARMDADDIAHPERLVAQLGLLEQDATIAAVGTQVEAFPKDAVQEGLRLYLEWQNSVVSKGDFVREIFVESPFCHPSVTMRRSAYETVGGYRDVSWAEDYDLWLRFHAAGYGLAKVPRSLLSWRHHAGQLTFGDARYSKGEFRKARATFLAPVLRNAGREVVIWGAGPTGKGLARELRGHGVQVSFFIDIDPAKIGRTRQGSCVYGPEVLAKGAQTIVVAVGARGARALIRDHLRQRAFAEGVDFIVAS